MTDIDLIKQKIDIVSFISEYIPLKKTGANFKGVCPFHTEKTPSFIVSPERQIWHCFGGCQIGGDIFKFLMKIENIEFPEALKILAKKAGVKLTQGIQTSKNQELKERIYAANHLASEFYNFLLTKHPIGKSARDYLTNRKISDNSINLFSIGYAPNSWDSLTKFLTKKGFSEQELIAAGLASKSSIGNLFDRFRGRLMFTLKDHRGNIVAFAGRLLDNNAKEAKYINTSETPVYTKGDTLYALETTKEEIKKNGFAVVVEGEIDCIQSYQAGVRNVVAIKGSAFTQSQVNLLKRYTENVYLSLDSDFAGDAAAHRGIEIADTAGLNIKVVTFTEGKDPDELIKKNPTLWHTAVKNAVNFYDYIIDSAVKKYNPTDANDSKKIVSEVAKFIAPIENLVVKNHYLKKLSQILDISTSDLNTQLNKEIKINKFNTSPTALTSPTNTIGEPPRSRNLLLEEYILSLLLQSPHPSDYLLLTSTRLKSADFENKNLGKIYELLLDFQEKFDINSFAKIIPPELIDIFNRLYLQENNLDFDNDSQILSEIQKTVWELKELALREKLKKISHELKINPDNSVLESDFAETTIALQTLLSQKSLLNT